MRHAAYRFRILVVVLPLLLLLPAGGIVANNASGMCCGVAQNTYHTIADMRLLLADGTVLDTADEASCKAFLQVRVGTTGTTAL
jgi:FAD/FMN-containing dehydrogenase